MTRGRLLGAGPLGIEPTTAAAYAYLVHRTRNAEEVNPFVPLYFDTRVYLERPELRNLHLNPFIMIDAAASGNAMTVKRTVERMLPPRICVIGIVSHGPYVPKRGVH
jgi:hypothetical protein